MRIITRLHIDADADLQGDPELFSAVGTALLQSGGTNAFDSLLAAQHGGTSPASLFALGTRLAQADLFDFAIKMFKRIPASECDEAVYFNLALAESHLGRFELARADYFRAIDARPWHIESYFHLGLDYAESGRPNLAIPWLSRAARLDPARFDIAAAYIRQLIAARYLQSAREVLAASESLAPSPSQLLAVRGDLAIASSDFSVASTFYSQALIANPNSVSATIGLGRLAAQKGDTKTALHYFTIADAADSKSPARLELGRLAVEAGDWRRAAQLLTFSCKTACPPEFRALLAKAMERSGNYTGALMTLTNRGDDDAPLSWHLQLVRIYRHLGREQDAAHELNIVDRLQRQPEEALSFQAPGVYVQ